MSLRGIKSSVTKALLSRSGNKCAFPGCPQPIVNDQFKLVAQLCHIEAVSPGGERFNAQLTPEQINGYANLMFLCYKHHVETDDVSVYTVEILKEMKRTHESKYVLSPYIVDMSHVFAIKRDIEIYWTMVEEVNTRDHVVPDLKIEIDTKAGYSDLSKRIEDTLASLENLISYIEKTDRDKYWEYFAIGIPNHLNLIRVNLDHMSIKYHEELLANNPHDQGIKDKLEQLRRAFLETAKHTGYLD